MAEHKRTGEAIHGEDVANVGRRERGIVGSSERRIRTATRPDQEMTHEVAQRGIATDAHDNRDEHGPNAAVTPDQTSGYGNREDRENPGAGLAAQQSGERQSHELVGEGTRVGGDEKNDAIAENSRASRRAMSQNGARISDFEDRPSR